MPRKMLEQLTGYGPDVGKNREEGRANDALTIAWCRDPAAILIDQLKKSGSMASSTLLTPPIGFPS
jgi:hypothetical protein